MCLTQSIDIAIINPGSGVTDCALRPKLDMKDHVWAQLLNRKDLLLAKINSCSACFIACKHCENQIEEDNANILGLVSIKQKRSLLSYSCCIPPANNTYTTLRGGYMGGTLPLHSMNLNWVCSDRVAWALDSLLSLQTSSTLVTHHHWVALKSCILTPHLTLTKTWSWSCSYLLQLSRPDSASSMDLDKLYITPHPTPTKTGCMVTLLSRTRNTFWCRGDVLWPHTCNNMSGSTSCIKLGILQLPVDTYCDFSKAWYDWSKNKPILRWWIKLCVPFLSLLKGRCPLSRLWIGSSSHRISGVKWGC